MILGGSCAEVCFLPQSQAAETIARRRDNGSEGPLLSLPVLLLTLFPLSVFVRVPVDSSSQLS